MKSSGVLLSGKFIVVELVIIMMLLFKQADSSLNQLTTTTLTSTHSGDQPPITFHRVSGQDQPDHDMYAAPPEIKGLYLKNNRVNFNEMLQSVCNMEEKQSI